MPDLQFNNISNAAAARMIAVYRKIPAPDGTLPPDDATNTVLWAHVKAVIGGFIRGDDQGPGTRQPRHGARYDQVGSL